MLKTVLPVLCSILSIGWAKAQPYPIFGPEIPVTITGLSSDAMEPHLSFDENTLFFNNLNDGITTGLYYATRIDDSTFAFAGELSGANQSGSPRLDAVASVDYNNYFYWISTRNYPADPDNVFHGDFTGTDVASIGRVHGDFYVYSPGWLVMDAAINYDGTALFYVNAIFSTCGSIPCAARIGIAEKINDSTFNKYSFSDSLLQGVNDTNYVVYAPCMSNDYMELYFTRFLKSDPSYTELCVCAHNSMMEPFGPPQIIDASSRIPEAITANWNKTRIYYHKKNSSGTYQIYMRYRTGTNGINETGTTTTEVQVYPNPATERLYIRTTSGQKVKVGIFDTRGEMVTCGEGATIGLSGLPAGLYIAKTETGNGVFTNRFLKQ